MLTFSHLKKVGSNSQKGFIQHHFKRRIKTQKWLYLKSGAGFTLLEIMISTMIMALLFGVVSFNLLRAQNSSSQQSNLDKLVSDIRAQQSKAMTGATEGRTSSANYGVYFMSDKYILFHGNVYNPSDVTNFTVNLPEDVKIQSTTLPSNTLLFSILSGEIVGYSVLANSIIFTSINTNKQTVITLNRYGVVTGVN